MSLLATVEDMSVEALRSAIAEAIEQNATFLTGYVKQVATRTDAGMDIEISGKFAHGKIRVSEDQFKERNALQDLNDGDKVRLVVYRDENPIASK